jgi:hypothetical protein
MENLFTNAQRQQPDLSGLFKNPRGTGQAGVSALLAPTTAQQQTALPTIGYPGTGEPGQTPPIIAPQNAPIENPYKKMMDTIWSGDIATGMPKKSPWLDLMNWAR